MTTLIRDIDKMASKFKHLTVLMDHLEAIEGQIQTHTHLFDELTQEQRELLEMASNCLESCESNLEKFGAL